MANLTLSLANTTCRRRENEEKDYRELVRLSVKDKSFAARVVSLHFADGPEMDLCTFDMDRIAIEYLKLRGVKLTVAMNKLLNVEPPPRCSFVVPLQQMSGLSRKSNRNGS